MQMVYSAEQENKDWAGASPRQRGGSRSRGCGRGICVRGDRSRSGTIAHDEEGEVVGLMGASGEILDGFEHAFLNLFQRALGQAR